MDTQVIDAPATAAEFQAFPSYRQNVIVRARDAGVHFGEYAGHTGREVKLTNSRRLWYWSTKQGISLSDVAQHGLNNANSKVAETVPSIVILDACEIIAVSDEAADSIREAPIAVRR